MICKERKVHTKLSEEDYNKICRFAEEWGFRSDYELLQKMLELLIRFVFDYDSKEGKGIPKEIEDMFKDFLTWPKTKPELLHYRTGHKKGYIKVKDRVKE